MNQNKKTITDSHSWLIPPEIYGPLNDEFHFDFDPCPYKQNKADVIDGIGIEWGKVNYVNPPFRRCDAVNDHGPTAFVRKAIEEQNKGKTSVLILPVQSYVTLLLNAGAEIRPVGRVRWVNGKDPSKNFAPSSNALFILRNEPMPKKKTTIIEEEKPVNYTARLQCKNCNRMRHAEIQKAKTVEAYSKETPCPNCGCAGMEKVK